MHVRRLRTGTPARSGAGRRIRAIGVAAAVLATALVAGAPPAPPAGAVPPRPADGRYHVVTVASSGSGQLAVDDLAAGPDGRMWYSAPAFATWAIGALTPAGERAVYPMPGPVLDLVAGSDGNMWAATADAIFRMGTGGGGTSFPLPPYGGPPASTTTIHELALGADGNVWYLRGGTTIGRVEPNGTITEFVQPDDGLSEIAAASGAAVWVADRNAHTLLRVTTAGAVTSTASPVSVPQALATGADGTLWVGGAGVGKLPPGGAGEVVTTEADVSHLAIAPDGGVWVADSFGISEVLDDGSLATRVVTGGTGDLTAGTDGYMWFARDFSEIAKVSWAPDPAGEFTGVEPARVFDSRSGLGRGGVTTPLASGSITPVQITGRGGVPADGVSAVVANVTVVGPTQAGFLTVWPAGGHLPTISNLNFVPGQTVPNLVTVGVGTGGQILVYNPAGVSHVVVDVVGWYADRWGAGGARYTSLSPSRRFDTRVGANGVPAAPLPPGGSLVVDVTGSSGVPSAGVTAVVMNVTVTEPTAAGYLTVHPGDGAVPLASNLNFSAGQTVANLVTVQVPDDGLVSFFNAVGTTHVIADVVGWYGPSDERGGRFIPVTPTRIVDSRPSRPIAGGESRLIQVAGRGIAPIVPAADVEAVALNVTAVSPTAAGYLTVYPDDDCQGPPFASNVNFTAGAVVPNMVLSDLGWHPSCSQRGSVEIYNPVGSTHVLVDVFGWFTGDTPP